MALAWAFDITPEGVVRTSASDETGPAQGEGVGGSIVAGGPQTWRPDWHKRWLLAISPDFLDLGVERIAKWQRDASLRTMLVEGLSRAGLQLAHPPQVPVGSEPV